MTSNREKKRRVQSGLNKLLSDPNWNPHIEKKSAKQQLRDLDQSERNQRIYEKEDSSTACLQCDKAREESDDDTALCQKHLKEIMGF